MMNIVDIGIGMHLPGLIDTCMLIQSSRGGGKSWLMRRMQEEISGECQQIIIDLEGEFVTLREKFPFALLAPTGGDIPLNIHHAGTYARKFMESNMSVIIDISDLKPADRAVFVRDFLHELMNLPKHLYHPLLVYIDEGHVFCPQDEGAVSYEAVIDIAARGRKRDIGLVLATQRVSKLHKDVTAELLNKVIGRTGQDIDQARAAKELDWKSADKSQLRKLVPGEFYCFGPALQEDIVKFHVGPVTTAHGKKRLIGAAAPPTPASLKAVLKSLQDLPKEAEQELITKEQLQTEVIRLRGEVTRLQNDSPSKRMAEVDIKAAVFQARLQMQKVFEPAIKERDQMISHLRAHLKETRLAFLQVAERLEAQMPDALVAALSCPIETMPEKSDSKPVENDKKPPKSDTKTQKSDTILQENSGDQTKPALGKCSKQIISFLAQSPNRSFSKTQIGIPIGYSPNAGGFNNSLGELSSRNMIRRDARSGIRIAGNIKEIGKEIGGFDTKNYRIADFRPKLPKCEQEIFDVLLASPHGKFSKESLAERTASRYTANAGGFNNSLGHLSTTGIIVREKGIIRLNPELIEFL